MELRAFLLVLCGALGSVVGELLVKLSEEDRAIFLRDSPRTVPLVPGNSYEIHCDGSDAEWSRVGAGGETDIISTTPPLGSGVYTAVDGNGMSLIVQELSDSETGQYVCTRGEEFFSINVTTGNPVVIPGRVVIGLEQGLQSGGNPNLNVFGSGNPQPIDTQYSWYFNGLLIYSSDIESPQAYVSVGSNEIVFRSNIMMSVSGVYESIVATAAGRANASIMLNVEVKPVPSISIISPTDYATEYLASGESVTVNCSDVEGVPAPDFSWRVGGTPVDENGLVFNITSGNSGRESYLTISDIDYATLDGAVIECEASNIVADEPVAISKSVDLMVLAPPPPPTNLTVASVSNCAVGLSWLPPPSFPQDTLPAQLLLLEGRPEGGDWASLMDEPISLSTTNLSVKVTNSTGVRNVLYDFRIRSVHVRGGASPETTETTKSVLLYDEDLPAVSSPSVSPLHSPPTSVLVSWTNTPSDCYLVLSHDISCYPSSSSSSSNTTPPSQALDGDATVTGARERGMVENLTVDTSYYCVVNSTLGDHSGEEFTMESTSDVANGFTFPARPMSPPRPMPTTTTPSSANISVTFSVAQDHSSISHYQIMVVRLLEDSDLPVGDPDKLYPTGYKFANYSTVNDEKVVKAVQGPYIAAEIAVGDFTGHFVIGSGTVSGPGSAYKNGPLLYGTKYSCFLRAFPKSSVLSGTRRRRQAGEGGGLVVGDKQYAVFSSSVFMEVVQTGDEPSSMSSSDPLDGTLPFIIVGTIVALFLILLIIFLFVLFCWYRIRRQRKYHFDARSPSYTSSSTKGSMELPPDSTPELCRRAPVIETKMGNFEEEEDSDLIPSGAIPVNLFREHVEKFDENRQLLFQREYDWIQANAPDYAAEASSLLVNDDKNRYSNIKAFDHSRVVLQAVNGVEGSDYINANYIPGYNRTKEYISTQGPLDQTIVDFWRMVWEQDTATIVMLTNLLEAGKAKCVQYWPSPSVGSMTCGDIDIKLDSVVDLSDYTIRNFTITHAPTGKNRTVLQFHYIKWPDYGTPKLAAPLLNFLRAVHTSNPPDSGPIIVHCSAGVGRSGTVITIDYCLAQLKADHVIDVRGFVSKMREHRNYMVQTEVQYAFIHYAILEAITYGDTSFPLADFPHSYQHIQQKNKETGQTLLEEEFSRLGSVKTMSKANTFVQRVKQKGPTNRSIHYPGHASYSEGNNPHEYNAHYIDSYSTQKLFVVADGPEVNNAGKFWQMVWDQNCTYVVMLTPLDANYYAYWPDKDEQETYGNIKVTVKDESAEHYYTKRTISISNAKVIGISHTVMHYQFIGWTGQYFPPVPMFTPFVCEILNDVESLQKSEKALVHDMKSMGPSGIFCSLCYCITRLRVERMVDVFQAVQSMQLQRPGTVSTMRDYAFVYDCVYEFIRTHSSS